MFNRKSNYYFEPEVTVTASIKSRAEKRIVTRVLRERFNHAGNKCRTETIPFDMNYSVMILKFENYGDFIVFEDEIERRGITLDMWEGDLAVI